MKKIFLGLALSLSLGLYACGGSDDGGNAQDPTSVDFSSPSGSLSEDNADDVGSEAVKANGSTSIQNPFGFLQDQTTAITNGVTGTECFSNISETGGTIDLGCFYQSYTGCNATGSVDYKFKDSLYSIKYNNVSISCEGYSYSAINGQWSFDTASGNYCTNYSVETEDGATYTSSGCFNAQGQMYITVDDESYVVESLNGDCSTATITIEDSSGSSSLTCDVVTETDSCTTFADVTAAESCEIATTE